MDNFIRTRIFVLLFSVAAALALTGFGTQKQKVHPNPFTIESVSIATQNPQLGEKISVVLDWKMVEGYHAYLDQFAVTAAAPEGARADWEDIRNVIEFDDKFSGTRKQGVKGQGQIFAKVVLPTDIKSKEVAVALDVTYQACTNDHCLLPKKARTEFVVPLAGAAPAGANSRLEVLGFDLAVSDLRLWLFIFIAGVMTSFTPCIFPMIPITLSVLGARHEGRRRRYRLSLSMSYVLGIALTYSLLGVIAAATGALFGGFLGQPVVVGALTLLFVAMAFSTMDWWHIQTPQFLARRLHLHNTAGGLGGAFIAGIVAGLVASPCVGPVLGGILAFVAQTKSLVLGFGLLFVFAWGLGLLFLILGTFAQAQRFLPRSGPWMEFVKYVFAASFFFIAIFYLQPWLSSERQWQLVGAALVLSLLTRHRVEVWWRAPRSAKLKHLGMTLLLMISGGLLWSGHYRPAAFGGLNFESLGPSYPTLPWQPYSDDALAKAKASGRPVIIDFYADWCVACKELERYTFSDKKIQALREDFEFLKFDATKESPEFKVLRERYGIVGLPHLVFIDPAGVWRQDLTLLGFEKADEFLKRCQSAKSQTKDK